jgi:hypothetical protein
VKPTGGALTQLQCNKPLSLARKMRKAAKQDSFKSPGALFDLKES